jgi:hypothetical protein
MTSTSEVHRFPSLTDQLDPPRVARAPRIHKPRSNILTAVIRAAFRNALDPEDAYSVWAQVVRMANQPNPPAPLLGHVSEGVQYTGREYDESGVPDLLTFKQFGDRFRRMRDSAR